MVTTRDNIVIKRSNGEYINLYNAEGDKFVPGTQCTFWLSSTEYTFTLVSDLLGCISEPVSGNITSIELTKESCAYEQTQLVADGSIDCVHIGTMSTWNGTWDQNIETAGRHLDKKSRRITISVYRPLVQVTTISHKSDGYETIYSSKWITRDTDKPERWLPRTS